VVATGVAGSAVVVEKLCVELVAADE